MEDKLSSTAEVLCKERKVLSITDCAVNKSLVPFWCIPWQVLKEHDRELCKYILRSAYMRVGLTFKNSLYLNAFKLGPRCLNLLLCQFSFCFLQWLITHILLFLQAYMMGLMGKTDSLTAQKHKKAVYGLIISMGFFFFKPVVSLIVPN